ncbi:MAG: hypothetical protein QNK37_06855 [Acidobacteriota bacterium]|nr:hypothetical protein [Acidobacteriota bacterium]
MKSIKRLTLLCGLGLVLGGAFSTYLSASNCFTLCTTNCELCRYCCYEVPGVYDCVDASPPEWCP